MNKYSNILNEKIANLLLTEFLAFRDKKFGKKVKAFMPNSKLKMKIIGGSAHSANYDDNAKNHRMKKIDYDDTPWDLIQDETGKGYIKNIFEILLEDY